MYSIIFYIIEIDYILMLMDIYCVVKYMRHNIYVGRRSLEEIGFVCKKHQYP